jgi:hypothetical protein
MLRSCFAAIALLAAPNLILAEDPPKYPSSPSQLGILMKFDVPPPKGVLEAMEHEVAGMLQPADVKVVWRLADQSDGRETFRHLVVLQFRGACRAQPASFGEISTFEGDGELANSTVREGQVMPFAEIHCDKVSSFLHPLRAAEQSAKLGAAIGRVVVHELYHILTDRLSHGAGEISKASLTAVDLARPLVRLSPAEIDLFRKSVQ